MSRWLVVVSTILCLAGFGCDFSGWNPFCPPVDHMTEFESSIDSTSAEGTLNRLVLAYQQLDADLYISCLDSAFIFYFDPDDDGIQRLLRECSIDQPWWGYTEECLATRSLFNEIREADGSINLSLVGDQAWYPHYGDFSIRVLKRNYSLDIQPSLVSGLIEGEATFTMVLKPTGAWKILRWWDKKLAL